MAGYFSAVTAQRGIQSIHDPDILSVAARYVVDPLLIKAVISAESAWNVGALRNEPQINDASYGLMQILHGTARGMSPTVTPGELFIPSINIDLGTRYLATQLQRFGYPGALAAYNGGPGNVTRWHAGTHPQQANVDRYVMTVDSFYSWFIGNDPLASGGAGDPRLFRPDTRSRAGHLDRLGDRKP